MLTISHSPNTPSPPNYLWFLNQIHLRFLKPSNVSTTSFELNHFNKDVLSRVRARALPTSVYTSGQWKLAIITVNSSQNPETLY